MPVLICCSKFDGVQNRGEEMCSCCRKSWDNTCPYYIFEGDDHNDNDHAPKQYTDTLIGWDEAHA